MLSNIFVVDAKGKGKRMNIEDMAEDAEEQVGHSALIPSSHLIHFL